MIDESQLAGTTPPPAPLLNPPQATDEAGPNLAPAKAIQEATKSDPYTPVDLLEFVKQVRTEMRKEKESEEWRNRILASQKNDLYYRGFQRLRKASYTNTWRVEDPKPINYTLNEFQFWCDVNESKWQNSRVDYRISGLNDTEDAAAAAGKLEWIADYYDDRDWRRTDIQSAAKQAMFTGHLIAYVYFDKNYKQRQAYVPVTERVTEKLGQDTYRCADCNYSGTLADKQPEGQENPDEAAAHQGAVCEACGSTRISITETPEFEVDKVTGQKEVEVGDVTHQLIPLYNIVWRSKVGFIKSPVVLWEEEHDKDALEARWPELRLPLSTVEDTGLAVKSSLENTGRGSSEKFQKNVLSRMWIEPSKYNRSKTKDDIQTVSGEVIKAGTPFLQRFPKGMHVIMVGDLIVDLYEAEKNEDLCIFEYESVPNGLAQGVDAMCEPQRQLNTVKSLINIWIRHNAVPPMQYVDGLVDPADITGDPTKPYPIQAGNLELYPGVGVENAVMYKVGQQIPQGVFEYEKMLRTNLQFAAKATEFSEGLPGVSNSTLGGAQIAQSLAQGIYSTILAAAADFRVELIKRKLKKFKKYVWDQRFFAMAGDYGIQEGEYLSGSDIPDDFEITPVPNSWSPRTPRQQQQNFQALLAAVGGPPGLAATPPALLQELCETFDVRLTGNEYPAAIRTARMRIRQAQKLLPSLQIANQAITQATGAPPMGDPQMQPAPVAQTPAGPVPVGQPTMVQQPISVGEQLFEALKPAFNPRESGHSDAIDYIRRFYTTDEGLASPPEIIEFCGVLLEAHLQAQSLENQVRAGVAGAGMPPAGVNAPLPPQPNTASASAMPVGG